jgi:hypothetical protein
MKAVRLPANNKELSAMPNLRLTSVTVAILLISGCAAKTPDTSFAAAATPKPDNCPTLPTPKLRTDLPPGSLDACGNPNWPPNNGFEPPKLNVIVPAGELLDRFGDTRGVYLSPRGAPYDQRALPYDCRGYTYTVYKVMRPLPAMLGTAAPAFGEPGGAIQLQTNEKVEQLLTEGVLQKADRAEPLACEVG